MDDKLIKLAKGGNKTPVKKKNVGTKVNKKLNPAEERDLKAKQKVEELLQDVPILNEKNENGELIEIDEPKHGIEWLEEQVTLLTEKNESISAELAIAKADYARIFNDYQELKKSGGVINDDVIKNNVIRVFNELQSNHQQLDKNFIIYPVAFMNRLIKFFPFLLEHKKY